jgi:hypothetical protein
MTIKNLIEETIQEATNRSIRQGLRVCPEADEILGADKSYAQVAKSIWKSLEGENEYIICLCAEDYREGDLRSPKDWGWKVPGILSLHLGMKGKECCEDISYGAIVGTDFYLFHLKIIE